MSTLKEKIYKITPNEIWHLNHPKQLSPFYNSLKTTEVNGKRIFFFDFVNTLKKYNIGLIKETRYTVIPEHLHKDMEMNYVYSGECTFFINGEKIELKQGDVCILDANVINSVKYKGEDDIVFNIIFRKSFFSSRFLTQFSKKDTLSEFLLNAIVGKQATDNFLIFHTKEYEKFGQVINLILEEHYFPNSNSIQVMEDYCSVLFFYLSRLAKNNQQNFIADSFEKNAFLILQEIEKRSGNCSLKDLEYSFHFSQSTIYKLLKNTTGKSFSEIKLENQLKKAKILLTESQIPILEIMENVGIKNVTYFYTKFKNNTGETPKQYRERNRSLQI